MYPFSGEFKEFTHPFFKSTHEVISKQLAHTQLWSVFVKPSVESQSPWGVYPILQHFPVPQNEHEPDTPPH